MSKSMLTSVLAIVAMCAGLSVLTASPALAHEIRQVGAYQFIVGFGDEPTYAGIRNSVILLLSKGGKPVTNLTDTLKVEVMFGTQKMQLPLEPTFDADTGLGTPGDYRAWFIPTEPGAYTFHFFGSIGSQKVDQSFSSGPSTFDAVVDPTAVEFPTKVPTITEVAARLGREFPRLSNAITTGDQQAVNRFSSARTLAVVGIALGALGLITAGAALLGWRRTLHRLTPLTAGFAPLARPEA